MYEIGLLVALCIWAYSLVATIALVNSRASYNLAKIGMRYSILTQEPKPKHAPNAWAWLRWVIVFGVSLVMVLLSWLYVAMFAGTLLYQLSKRSGMPQNIKEFRWRLRNLDLPQDQVIREFMKMAEIPEDRFEAARTDLVDEAAQRGLYI